MDVSTWETAWVPRLLGILGKYCLFHKLCPAPGSILLYLTQCTVRARLSRKTNDYTAFFAKIAPGRTARTFKMFSEISNFIVKLWLDQD